MAEVLLGQGEPIDGVLLRLKRAVKGEGFLKAVKNRRFAGAQTTSQKKRIKSRKAQKRWLKLQGQRNFNSDPLDQHDTDKLDQQEHPAFRGDASWATSDFTWNPDLTPVKIPRAENFDEAFSRSRQSVLGFGRNYNYDPNVPSVHSCVIIECVYNRKKSLLVVRGLEDDNITPRMFHQFPGGGVELEKGEMPEQAAVRETKEEIGLDIEEPTKEDLVFKTKISPHTFICYRATVKGGKIKKGDEIAELKAFSLKELKASLKVGAPRILSRNHAFSFEAFLEKRKSVARKSKVSKKEAGNV